MTTDNQIRVFSGKCCLSDIGISVGAKDSAERDLHTGDIVMLWHGDYLDTDIEEWNTCGGLTVVVSDQYTTYNNSDYRRKDGDPDPFVMGIKSARFNDPAWRIQIVKKFNDVVDGEHWPEYGFSYRAVFIESKVTEPA